MESNATQRWNQKNEHWILFVLTVYVLVLCFGSLLSCSKFELLNIIISACLFFSLRSKLVL